MPFVLSITTLASRSTPIESRWSHHLFKSSNDTLFWRSFAYPRGPNADLTRREYSCQASVPPMRRTGKCSRIRRTPLPTDFEDGQRMRTRTVLLLVLKQPLHFPLGIAIPYAFASSENTNHTSSLRSNTCSALVHVARQEIVHRPAASSAAATFRAIATFSR